MSAGISAIRIPCSGTHKASIIWLHGLGDTGRGWSFIQQFYNLSHVKWVFPNAPPIAITVNFGHKMPGWFDITSLGADIMSRQDEEGMLKSVNLVHRLITEEVDAGISSENIIVGGFSQGCAIAILAGYTCERKLGGVVGLSGWLPLHKKFASMRTDANLKTPLWQGHGKDDTVVNFRFGKQSHEEMKKLGMDVEFHEYDGMGHEANPQELKDLGKWITDKIGSGQDT